MPWSLFYECWVLNQIFHSPLSPASWGSLVPLPFLSLGWLSSTYLRLLIFLLAILIPACDSSSRVFLMMYSAYKLNKQSDNIQPWHTPFPILNQSSFLFLVLCCFLTCIQISQEAGQVVWYFRLLNFPQFAVIHILKVFRVVSEAEIDVFFFFFPGIFLLFLWSAGVGNLISCSPAFP